MAWRGSGWIELATLSAAASACVLRGPLPFDEDEQVDGDGSGDAVDEQSSGTPPEPSPDPTTPDTTGAPPGSDDAASPCGESPNDAPYGSCSCHADCLDEWCQAIDDWSACSTICPDGSCPPFDGYQVRCLLPADYPWNEHCAIMCDDGRCPQGMTCRSFAAGHVCVHVG